VDGVERCTWVCRDGVARRCCEPLSRYRWIGAAAHRCALPPPLHAALAGELAPTISTPLNCGAGALR